MAAFAFLPALVHGVCGAEVADVDRPDILLIPADDPGYGQKHVQAPNIDRLAAEGMEFRRFYAGATVSAQLDDDRTASRPHPRVRQGRQKLPARSDSGEATAVAAAKPGIMKQLDEHLRTARIDSAFWPVREPAPGKARSR